MMKLFIYLYTICLLSLVGANHSILNNIVQTSVGLTSDPSNPDHFLVSVEKLDDIANKSRVVSVALNFEVSGDLLFLNGKKAGLLGNKMNLREFEATYIPGDLSEANQANLSSHFVQGIISLIVSTKVESFLIVDEFDPFGLPVVGRRITIKEDILEVDEFPVTNSQPSEHVIDLFANGTTVRTISKPHFNARTLLYNHEKYPFKGIQVLQLLRTGHFKEAWFILHPTLRGASIGFLLGLVFSLLAAFPIYLCMTARGRNQVPGFPLSLNNPSPYSNKRPDIYSCSKDLIDYEITILERKLKNLRL